MTIQNFLRTSTTELTKHDVFTARLDCLVLLEDLLNTDRTQLLANGDKKLSVEQLSILNQQIERRGAHEPLAYIRGKTEFYGREFVISPDTLEPRPETETMIELVKSLGFTKGTKLADIGAGSGAIGITLALEIPGLLVDMYELSKPAIEIAKKNIMTNGVQNCHIYKSDLLADLKTNYQVIVANLPYVPDSHTINPAAMHEPKLAIFGGPDGLDIYRRLFSQIAGLDHKPHYVLTEALPPQHKELELIAKQSGYKQLKTDDFIQVYELT